LVIYFVVVMCFTWHLFVLVLTLKATAVRSLRTKLRKLQREPNCTLGDLNTEVLATTDIFMRSYHGDLEWVDYSVPSIAESMLCSMGVIRNVLVVVPEADVPAFNEKIDALWNKEQFPGPLRQRWQVMPSKVKVVGDGYQEQMLDKLHADLYSDAQHFVYLDTDTALVSDLRREQLFDDGGKPYLCYRSASKCGEQCERWMQLHVKLMIGEGEMLDHEFMCLGEAFPRYLYPHLRVAVVEHKSVEWLSFTTQARTGGASPWSEPGGEGGFTEFNTMGAVMWRDFHDRAHWLNADMGESWIAPRYLQTWSWEKDDQKRDAAKRLFECVRELQHDTEEFDFNRRIVDCNEKAAAVSG